MKTRRSKIAVGSVVILLLVGIGAFLAYDTNAPVQQVRVYEVPDSVSTKTQPEVNVGMMASPSVKAKATRDMSPAEKDRRIEELQQERAELERAIAEKERAIAEESRIGVELKRINKQLKAEARGRRELRAFAEWLDNEWAPSVADAHDEGIFLVDWIRDGLTPEEYQEIFPDVADQEYYVQKVVEMGEARRELIDRLGNSSEGVRDWFFDTYEHQCPDPAAWDEFVDKVNSKVREG